MTGLERIRAAFHRQPVDRTPWVPFVGVHGGYLLDITATEYLKSADRLVEGIEKSIELYAPDGVPGEGAFYGPKIEFVLKDSIGRAWQCGTIQVDFSMPGRLDASYIAEDGSKQVPVMIHRAILGSMERFIGILIEHYAGNFPIWLAPEQVRVLPISEKTNDYAAGVLRQLKEVGLIATLDTSDDKVGAKIARAHGDKIPYMLVLGPREASGRPKYASRSTRRAGTDHRSGWILSSRVSDRLRSDG